jgi:uncharacterized protein YndB with AHSA1/START domain
MNKLTLVLAGTILAGGTLAASAASIDKSVTVNAPADKVWSMIGPFCAIKDWHPAIGQCTESGGVRTLVTKDGKATFVEKQTASDDKTMMYSYAIEKSPLPITGYTSTIQVTPDGKDKAKVEWSSTYTPDAGKAEAAKSALDGIYQGGLDNIKKMAGS